MDVRLIVLALVATAALLVAGCTAPGPSPAATPPAQTPTPAASTPSTASVTISGFAFQPANVTIKQGGTVTWTNDDSMAHTVTFTDNTGSDQLQKGGSYSRQFNVTGEFDYHCSIHPYMTGVVTVV